MFEQEPDFLFEMQALLAQFDAPSGWRPGGRGFNPPPPHPEGQLSFPGESMCTVPVNRLED